MGYYFLRPYSYIFAIGVALWGAFFIQFWRVQEHKLTNHWSTVNCQSLAKSMTEFKPQSYRVDSLLGTARPYYPQWEIIVRSTIANVPLFLISGCILLFLIAIAFIVDVTLSEVYSGPLKSIVSLLPAVVFQVLTLPFTFIYSIVAERLTKLENRRTKTDFQASLSGKMFLQNFMLSYTALFLISYIYGPFAEYFVPHYIQNRMSQSFFSVGYIAKSTFKLNPLRLRNQYIYFLTNAQVINYITILAVPQLISYVKKHYMSKPTRDLHIQDIPSETVTLKRARSEAEKIEYDCYNDYKDFVLMFGFLVMFSPIYPLAPIFSLVNCVLYIRSSVYRFTKMVKKPVPCRVDSIAPWDQRLSLLSWLGCITMPSICYFYSSTTKPSDKSMMIAAVIGLLSEHLWFLLRMFISSVFPVDKTFFAPAKERQHLLAERSFSIPPVADVPTSTTTAFEEADETLSIYRTAENKKTK